MLYAMFAVSAQDLVEATADLVVLTGLGTLPAEVGQQVALLQRCAQVTAGAMPRLKAMKGLSDYRIEVNSLENEADKLDRRLLSRLCSGEFDALEILELEEVSDQLEEAADAFEHVALRLSAVRWGVAGNIVVARVLTLPAAGAVAAGVYYVTHAVVG